MKLIYDEQGRLSEILGSGENGDLTTNEVSAFKTYMDNEEKDYLDNIKNPKILLNPKKWYIIKTRCDESEE